MTINNEKAKAVTSDQTFLIDFKIDCKCILSEYQAKKWLITSRLFDNVALELVGVYTGYCCLIIIEACT